MRMRFVCHAKEGLLKVCAQISPEIRRRISTAYVQPGLSHEIFPGGTQRPFHRDKINLMVTLPALYIHPHCEGCHAYEV
jgi:hypothetical protein